MGIKGQTFFRINSKNLPECIRYYKENDLRYIALNHVRDFDENNLKFLKGLFVEGIEVHTILITDYQELLEHEELKYADLSEIPTSPFDFKKLPKLEFFSGVWSSNYKNLTSLTELRELRIGKYKSPTGDLTELAGLKNLEKLHITESNIKSCQGIERLKKLKKISLAYNKSLQTFTASKSRDFRLEEIEIEVCKKFDLTSLKGVEKLKSLRIINNGKIQSLESLLTQMPLLEKLQFTESELADGNNPYLLRHPSLKEVEITDRKHYLLKERTINEALNDDKKRKAILKNYGGLHQLSNRVKNSL